MLADRGVELDEDLAARFAAEEARGRTVVAAVVDGAPAGIFVVADRVKPTSADAIARLRELGLEQETVVVLLADHGEEFREHGRDWHGNTLYAEVLRIPLVFFCPARIRAGRVADNVSIVDVLPTLRAFLGLPADPASAGLSLLGSIEGQALPQRALYAHLYRQAGLWQQPDELRLRAVIQDNWKLVASATGDELFDMRADPEEARNRLGEAQDMAKLLGQRLTELEGRMEGWKGESVALPLDAETQKKLRALGYVN
jgi:arylsulfatase A-like enzyme